MVSSLSKLIWRIYSSMVISMKFFIWSYILDLLLKWVIRASLSHPHIFKWPQSLLEFGLVNSETLFNSLLWLEVDHLAYYCHVGTWCVYSVVYVDDIAITGSDHQNIKHRLCHCFQTKNYGRLQNFLVIENRDGTIQGWHCNFKQGAYHRHFRGNRFN